MDRHIRVLSVEANSVNVVKVVDLGMAVRSVAVSTDGSVVYAGSMGHILRLDVATLQPRVSLDVPERNRTVDYLTVSGPWLLAPQCDTNKIIVYKHEELQVTQQLEDGLKLVLLKLHGTTLVSTSMLPSAVTAYRFDNGRVGGKLWHHEGLKPVKFHYNGR